MTRRLIPGLLVLAFAAAGLFAQDKPGSDPDEPPVRLKKKERPAAAKEEPPKPPMKTEPAKPRAEEKKPALEEKKKGDEPPDAPEQPEKDEEELLNHALKESRSAEERLGKADAGDATQQLQRDVLKDLESLVDQSRRGQQDQNQNQDQAQGQQQQDQQNQPGQNPKGQTKGQQKSGQGQPKSQPGMGGGRRGKGARRGQQQVRHWRRQGGGNRVGRGKGNGNAELGRDDPSQSENTGAQGKQPGGGGKSGEQANNLAEVYKDIWGELPKSLRQEMNAYSREEFMAKYKDVLKQYYATIAEKGRHRE